MPKSKPDTIIKNGQPRRVHRELEAETDPETEYHRAADDAETDDVPPSSRRSSAGEDVAEETTPEKSERYSWLKRVNAQRALDHAIKQVSKHDFSQWPSLGAHGVDGALNILRNVSEKMNALNKRTRPGKKGSFETGAVVKLTKKAIARYDGIIEATDRITVKTCVKRGLQGTLTDGTRVALRLVDVEAAS